MAERKAARVFPEPVGAAVVLLGSRLCGPGAAEFARRLGADPVRPAIPVLAVSGDGDWLRLTSLSEDLRPPAELDELSSLLDVHDDPRYRFERGDIADKHSLAEAIRKHHIDTIVNFAAESHVDRSILEPDAFIHKPFRAKELQERIRQIQGERA